MVASEHHRSLESAIPHGLVEGQCDLRPSLSIGIEDTRLRTHHQVVAPSLADPVDVIIKLSDDILSGGEADSLQSLCSQTVCQGQVIGVAGGAHPPERPESIVEEEGSHDVLDIRRIAEPSVGQEDVGPGPACLQHEGVAVVEEIHPPRGESVDGSNLSSERLAHTFLESVGLSGHHAF